MEVLLALSAQNARLEAQVEQLTAKVAGQDERIATLERQLGRSSRNSSQPPSADPPRRGKDPSGRKQGAQPGHVGKGRPLLPAWAVDEIVEHWPSDWTRWPIASSWAAWDGPAPSSGLIVPRDGVALGMLIRRLAELGVVTVYRV